MVTGAAALSSSSVFSPFFSVTIAASLPERREVCSLEIKHSRYNSNLEWSNGVLFTNRIDDCDTRFDARVCSLSDNTPSYGPLPGRAHLTRGATAKLSTPKPSFSIALSSSSKMAESKSCCSKFYVSNLNAHWRVSAPRRCKRWLKTFSSAIWI